jgi:hypothetical protein
MIVGKSLLHNLGVMLVGLMIALGGKSSMRCWVYPRFALGGPPGWQFRCWEQGLAYGFGPQAPFISTR